MTRFKQYIQINWTDWKKWEKCIASNHSPCFLSKLPKRNGANHLIFQQEFPVFPCNSKKALQWRIKERGQGSPCPLFFLDQTEAQRAEKKTALPSPLSQGLDDRASLPPLPEGLDRSLNSLAFSTFSISLSVQTSTVHGFAGLFIRQTPMANV